VEVRRLLNLENGDSSMLVLSRKPCESVVVGGSTGFERLLKVTVVEIGGGKVKLGFEIDQEVPVHRWEVWEQIQAKARQSIGPDGHGPPGVQWNHNKPPLQGMGHSRLMNLPHATAEVAPKYGILIADDEQCVRSLLTTVMQEQGFAVWLAADGQEAIELYQRYRKHIDVVLLDVRMPGLDGPQSLAILRKMNPAIRCCLMSGDLGSYAETVLRSLGAAALIRKPFLSSDVARMLWELASNAERSPAKA
jgi:carbon storage regulator CsrA